MNDIHSAVSGTYGFLSTEVDSWGLCQYDWLCIFLTIIVLFLLVLTIRRGRMIKNLEENLEQSIDACKVMRLREEPEGQEIRLREQPEEQEKRLREDPEGGQ